MWCYGQGTFTIRVRIGVGFGMKELEGQRRWEKYPSMKKLQESRLKWYGHALRR